NIRLDERVAERNRIARDFHDTLLQSFQGALMKFSTVKYLMRAVPLAARSRETVQCGDVKRCTKQSFECIEALDRRFGCTRQESTGLSFHREISFVRIVLGDGEDFSDIHGTLLLASRRHQRLLRATCCTRT